MGKAPEPPAHQVVGIERQGPLDMAHPLLSLAAEIGDAEAAHRQSEWAVVSRLQRAPRRFQAQRLKFTKPAPTIGNAYPMDGGDQRPGRRKLRINGNRLVEQRQGLVERAFRMLGEE